MKKSTFSIEFESAPSAGELPEADAQLMELARAACQTAYAPYSQFRVGAALRLADGTTISGSNMENASYPLCLCAERTALATAHTQHPDTAVVAIAITAVNARRPVLQAVAPCGACRQVMLETEQRYGQAMRVILQGESGPVICLHSARDLLPLAFDRELL